MVSCMPHDSVAVHEQKEFEEEDERVGGEGVGVYVP